MEVALWKTAEPTETEQVEGNENVSNLLQE